MLIIYENKEQISDLDIKDAQIVNIHDLQPFQEVPSKSTSKANWRDYVRGDLLDYQEFVPVKIDEQQIDYYARGIRQFSLILKQGKIQKISLYRSWDIKPYKNYELNDQENVKAVQVFDREHDTSQIDFLDETGNVMYSRRFYNGQLTHASVRQPNGDMRDYQTQSELYMDGLTQFISEDEVVINFVREVDDALLALPVQQRRFVLEQSPFAEGGMDIGIIHPNYTSLFFQALSPNDLVIVLNPNDYQAIKKHFPYLVNNLMLVQNMEEITHE